MNAGVERNSTMYWFSWWWRALCIFIRGLLSALWDCTWYDRWISISPFFIHPYRYFDRLSSFSEEVRVQYLAHRWVEFGLNNVQLINYNVLISSPGSSPNTITDIENKQCFLPSGASCDTETHVSINESFAFAAYSSVGSLEVQHCLFASYKAQGHGKCTLKILKYLLKYSVLWPPLHLQLYRKSRCSK